jgi:hypothetical protein
MQVSSASRYTASVRLLAFLGLWLFVCLMIIRPMALIAWRWWTGTKDDE